MPPASRNQRVPRAGATPTPAAASSLERPAAINTQNWRRSSRRATEGRPGDRNAPRRHRSERRLRGSTATSLVEVLRRPLEPALLAKSPEQNRHGKICSHHSAKLDENRTFTLTHSTIMHSVGSVCPLVVISPTVSRGFRERVA